MSKIQSTDQAARKEDFRTFLELLLPYLRTANDVPTNESVISSDLVVTKAMGGISAGQTYTQGTTIETILRGIIRVMKKLYISCCLIQMNGSTHFMIN